MICSCMACQRDCSSATVRVNSIWCQGSVQGCKDSQSVTEEQSMSQPNYIRRLELTNNFLACSDPLKLLSLPLDLFVIMYWKIGCFRDCHRLHALHSCQTVITIILFLFCILLSIKPFPSHLFSSPNIFASTILSDFQLFKQHQFLVFCWPKGSSCFCLYLLPATLLTKSLGNLSPVASWHKQGARSWTLLGAAGLFCY